MKKFIFYLLFTLNVLCVYGQVNNSIIVSQYSDGITKIAYKIVGKDSILCEYFSSGKIRMCAKYLKGTAKMSGVLRVYYENSQLDHELFCDTTSIGVNAHKGILYKSWYETGEIKRLQYYSNGNIVQSTSFFKSGKIKSIEHNDSDGIPVIQFEFYESGYLGIEKIMCQDTTTYSIGLDIVRNVSTYIKHIRKWYDGGILDYEGQFSLGKRRGKWLFYNENGLLEREEIFK